MQIERDLGILSDNSFSPIEHHWVYKPCLCVGPMTSSNGKQKLSEQDFFVWLLLLFLYFYLYITISDFLLLWTLVVCVCLLHLLIFVGFFLKTEKMKRHGVGWIGRILELEVITIKIYCVRNYYSIKIVIKLILFMDF